MVWAWRDVEAEEEKEKNERRDGPGETFVAFWKEQEQSDPHRKLSLSLYWLKDANDTAAIA